MKLIATRLYRRFSKPVDSQGIFPVRIATGDLGNFADLVDLVLKQVFLLDFWKRDVKAMRSVVRSWVTNQVDHQSASSHLLGLVETSTFRKLSSRSLLILRNLFATVGLFQVSGLVDAAYAHRLENEILKNPKRKYVTEAIFRRAVSGNPSSAIELIAQVEPVSFNSKVGIRWPSLRMFVLGFSRSGDFTSPKQPQADVLSTFSGKLDTSPVLLVGPGRLEGAKIENPSLRQAHLLGPGNDPSNYPPTSLLYMRRKTCDHLIRSGTFRGTEKWGEKVILDEPQIKMAPSQPQTLSHAMLGLKSIGSNFHPLMGVLAAMDLLANGAEVVHVDGLDFYLSTVAYRSEALRDLDPGSKLDREIHGGKQFLDGSNGRGSFERCSILAAHSVFDNILIMRFLLDAKRLSVEDGLREILELDSSEIHRRLDELYGADRK